jgi:hypothetical protein
VVSGSPIPAIAGVVSVVIYGGIVSHHTLVIVGASGEVVSGVQLLQVLFPLYTTGLSMFALHVLFEVTVLFWTTVPL